MRFFRHLCRYFESMAKDALGVDLSVRRSKLPYRLDGRCCYTNGRFEIRICRDLDENTAIMVLIHEVAHVWSWEYEDHGDEWGLAYAMIYRIMLRLLKEKRDAGRDKKDC